MTYADIWLKHIINILLTHIGQQMFFFILGAGLFLKGTQNDPSFENDPFFGPLSQFNVYPIIAPAA